MSFFALLLLFVAASRAGMPSTCSTKDHLQTCVFGFVDNDHNGNVTVAELDHFLMYDPCDARPPRVTGLAIMNRCDKNGDGVISDVDFTHDSSCANTAGMVRVGCRICNKCNGVPNGAKRSGNALKDRK